MKILLPVQSQLLRGRFRKVRTALSGPRFGAPQRPPRQEVVVFGKKDDLISTKIQNKPQVPLLEYKDKLIDNSTQLKTVAVSRQPKSWFSWRLALFALFSSISVGLLLVLFAPVMYYMIFSADPVPIKASEAGTPLGGEYAQGTQNTRPTVPEPAQDETLPEGNWLVIPRIGVRTEILESEKAEDSLTKGVWRVPEYGVPSDRTKPMILAAHRYGYNWWWKGDDYWKYHSFYSLPETQPGDKIEIISNKRKYVYEIYGGEEGTEIKDYEADLILYTCKFLNSDVRHFRYARLIDPDKATQ